MPLKPHRSSASLLAKEPGWSTNRTQLAVDQYVAKINGYLTTAGLKPEINPDLPSDIQFSIT